MYIARDHDNQIFRYSQKPVIRNKGTKKNPEYFWVRTGGTCKMISTVDGRGLIVRLSYEFTETTLRNIVKSPVEELYLSKDLISLENNIG